MIGMKRREHIADGEPWARVSVRNSEGKMRVCGWLNMLTGSYLGDEGEVQLTRGHARAEIDGMELRLRLYLRVEGMYFHAAGWREEGTGRIVWETARGPNCFGVMNHKFL